jgi:hypothetical protein
MTMRASSLQRNTSLVLSNDLPKLNATDLHMELAEPGPCKAKAKGEDATTAPYLTREGEQVDDGFQPPISHRRVSTSPVRGSKQTPLLSAFVNHIKADEKDTNAIAELRA